MPQSAKAPNDVYVSRDRTYMPKLGTGGVKGRRASSEASVDLAEALVQAEMAQLT